MAGGMPWAARVARQPAIASRMLSRASAFGPSLRDAAGDRRALDDEHAGFVRLQRHEELHTWILSRCGSSSNFPLSPSPSFARNGQAGRPVLPPAGHDYFLLGVEADGVFAVSVAVALPKGQAFTKSMASSSVLTRITLSTGPNISSRAMVIWGVTWSKMVGPRKYPPGPKGAPRLHSRPSTKGTAPSATP